MHQPKTNHTIRHRLILTAILLVACLSLLATATWARYQTSDFWYLNYAAKSSGSVQLWSYYNENTGTYSNAQSSWDLSDDCGTLDFYVSNGTPSAPAAEDQQVSIRLMASLAVSDYVDEVSLYITLDGTTSIWTAEPMNIDKGTALYQSFGDGQVYIFRDESGMEQTWTLSGGALSILSAQIEVLGLNQSLDTTLLQLQVSSN